MKLQKGITGLGSEPTFVMEDLVNVLKNIKQPFVKIGDIHRPNESTSFYQVKLKNVKNDEEFYLLMNSTYMIFACVNKNRCFDLNFIDFPTDLITQIKANFKSSVILLNPKDLIRKIEQHDLEFLSESEMKQINYWKSKTVGEVIFNCYD